MTMGRTRLATLLTPSFALAAALVLTTAAPAAAQTTEEFYDARFPVACDAKAEPAGLRASLKARIRTELKRANATVESIAVLDIKCARASDGKLLGAVVLAYGTPRDMDATYAQFGSGKNIRALLDSEQYGLFQFDASLATLKTTIKVFPSQRWGDYIVKIDVPSPDVVVLEAGGSYTYPEFTERLKLIW